MITVDLSRREGESVHAHLQRVASMHALPGVGKTREPVSNPEPWPRGTPEPDIVRDGRERALALLRPRRSAR